MAAKRLLLTVCFLTATLSVFPLDLTEWQDALAGVFGDSAIDKNEGTTVFRSLNIPSGGRSESLGTAYTGLSDDSSFFDYNPAGSAVLERTEIAVFHNAWIADSAMETVAATTRNGDMGMGVQLKCFYVPFTEYNMFGQRVAGSYYSETSLTLNAAHTFFSGYKFRGLSVGANVRGSWRNMPDYTDDATDEIISGSGLAQSALACMTDLGVLARFTVAKYFNDREPNLRLGLSVNNIGVALTGFGERIQLDDALPTRVSVGISYRPVGPLLVSAEFRQPVHLKDITKSGKWSAGAGIEIRVTSFFALDAGFLLQGGNPRISLGSGFDVRGVQMNVNYTFDLTSSLNPVNHISLSAKLRLSDRGRAQKQAQIDALYTLGLEQYAAGDFDSARQTWLDVLRLDRHFDPALEGLKAIERSERLYQHILDIQSLD